MVRGKTCRARPSPGHLREGQSWSGEAWRTWGLHLGFLPSVGIRPENLNKKEEKATHLLPPLNPPHSLTVIQDSLCRDGFPSPRKCNRGVSLCLLHNAPPPNITNLSRYKHLSLQGQVSALDLGGSVAISRRETHHRGETLTGTESSWIPCTGPLKALGLHTLPTRALAKAAYCHCRSPGLGTALRTPFLLEGFALLAT